jgi:hypothetical protein
LSLKKKHWRNKSIKTIRKTYFLTKKHLENGWWNWRRNNSTGKHFVIAKIAIVTEQHKFVQFSIICFPVSCEVLFNTFAKQKFLLHITIYMIYFKANQSMLQSGYHYLCKQIWNFQYVSCNFWKKRHIYCIEETF